MSAHLLLAREGEKDIPFLLETSREGKEQRLIAQPTTPQYYNRLGDSLWTSSYFFQPQVGEEIEELV